MDVSVEYHGSICMVRPHTPEAAAWIDENIALESWQWRGGAFSCEPRYVDDLIAGMQEGGLQVGEEEEEEEEEEEGT